MQVVRREISGGAVRNNRFRPLTAQFQTTIFVASYAKPSQRPELILRIRVANLNNLVHFRISGDRQRQGILHLRY